MPRLTSADRVVILMHEGSTSPKGKTGQAFLRYSSIPTVAVIDSAATVSHLSATASPAPVPVVDSVADALPFRPTTLLIGIAPSGGQLPAPWFQEVASAVAAGLNVVNGLHTPMANHPQLPTVPGQWIWDVRQEPPNLSVGTGQARTLTCKRVLAVGTDMAVGKMSTILELHKAFQSLGQRSKIIATGQTNLMLGDDGIPLDAIRVDFASGAVEQQIMKYANTYDVLLVEGQGSIFNPSSTATLPLLRGTQPTHLVLAHRAGQTHIQNFPHIPIPPIPEAIDLYERLANAGGAFFPSKVIGIALNTGRLNATEAAKAMIDLQHLTGLICTDVFRSGANDLAQAILNSKNEEHLV